VTRCASCRSRLVEENVFAAHFPYVRVTAVAFDASMSALQRKLGSPIMIEKRRRPDLRVMAVGARSSTLLRNELASVRIDVAAFAILRGAFELDFSAPRKRLMARTALHNAVHSS